MSKENNKIMITLSKAREAIPDHICLSRVVNDDKVNLDSLSASVPLSQILKSGGINNALWCIENLPEHNDLWRRFSHWCVVRAVEGMNEGSAKEDVSNLIVSTINDISIESTDDDIKNIHLLSKECVERLAVKARLTEFDSDKWKDVRVAESVKELTRSTSSISAEAISHFVSLASKDVDKEINMQKQKLISIADTGRWC